MFEASCHCGKIKLSANQIPDSLTSCNCSICHRLGALWAYFPSIDVDLPSDDLLTAYQWGEKTMDFHRCRECGCTTHYTTTEQDGTLLVAVNSRMAEISTTKNIPIRRFDGAVSWEYLDD